MTWWRKEPRHQQPWYWLCWLGPRTLRITVNSLIQGSSYNRLVLQICLSGQNSGCVLYWRFWGSQCDIWGLASDFFFFTVRDNRWSCGRAKFQGNPASKMSSPFHNNIVLEILDHQQTSNQFDAKISVDDIAFSVLFTCSRSEILDPSKKLMSTWVKNLRWHRLGN